MPTGQVETKWAKKTRRDGYRSFRTRCTHCGEILQEGAAGNGPGIRYTMVFAEQAATAHECGVNPHAFGAGI
jgi:hypothetical protein